MSQTISNSLPFSSRPAAAGRKGTGFVRSFFAALHTARAIEAGVSPKATDLMVLGIQPDALIRTR